MSRLKLEEEIILKKLSTNTKIKYGLQITPFTTGNKFWQTGKNELLLGSRDDVMTNIRVASYF